MANPLLDNRQLGPDTARANLLTNGGFEIWQRGIGPISGGGGIFGPDRWMGFGNMTQARDQGFVDANSNACCKLVVTDLAGGPAVWQTMRLITDFSTRQAPYSASVRVWGSVLNGIRVTLNDGTTTAYSQYHTGTSQYETLTATLANVNQAATTLTLSIVPAVTGTYYLDNATLVPGVVPANYAPLHPADDLHRCQRYYEVIGLTLNELSMAGYNTAGAAVTQYIPYKVNKTAGPSVTKTGTWVVTNTGQPTVVIYGATGLSLQAVPTATGAFALTNNAAGANLIIEANP